jgi:hypothetical protein
LNLLIENALLILPPLVLVSYRFELRDRTAQGLGGLIVSADFVFDFADAPARDSRIEAQVGSILFCETVEKVLKRLQKLDIGLGEHRVGEPIGFESRFVESLYLQRTASRRDILGDGTEGFQCKVQVLSSSLAFGIGLL